MTKEADVVAGSSTTKEVEVVAAPAFFDFFEVFLDTFLDFEVSPFLFLENKILT